MRTDPFVIKPNLKPAPRSASSVARASGKSAIAFDEHPHIVILGNRLQGGCEAPPLIAGEPLEARVPIEQRSVEIEEDRADSRQH
jgi:hypothetical protein